MAASTTNHHNHHNHHQQSPATGSEEQQTHRSDDIQPPASSDQHAHQHHPATSPKILEPQPSQQPSTFNHPAPSSSSSLPRIRDHHTLNSSTQTTSNNLVAYSSQHIIATPLHHPNHSQAQAHPHPITIIFSILPVTTRPTPSWSFTLPKPPIPQPQPQPLATTTTSPPLLLPPSSHHPSVDHLLFSPDGTHLLISSHIPSSHQLRLSILIQSNSKADEWRLGWDHVLPHATPDHLSDRSESSLRRVASACFLTEPRRWFTESLSNASNIPDDHVLSIRSLKYQKVRRTPATAINSFVHGKGQIAVLVLSTNELLVIHIPLPQMNLTPHLLLTNLDNSTLAAAPMKLLPTSSYPPDSELEPWHDPILHPPTSNPDPLKPNSSQAQKPPETLSLHRPLDFSSSSPFGSFTTGLTPFPPSDHLQSLNRPHNSSCEPLNSNLKEITMATIGLPASRRSTHQQIDDPHLLIAFQTHIKPRIPNTTKQAIILDHNPNKSNQENQNRSQNRSDEFHHHQIGGLGGVGGGGVGSQFPMSDEDLVGDYITGLGDLDDAFDIPMTNNEFSSSNGDNSNTNNQNDPAIKSTPSKLPGGEDLKASNLQDHVLVSNGANPKSSSSSIQIRKRHKTRRRFEPIYGIDDFRHRFKPNHDDVQVGSYGFIELVELFIDFDENMIPTVTMQLLPSLPIINPFEQDRNCHVVLRTLDFINVSSEPTIANHPNPEGVLMRLLATYSRGHDHGPSKESASGVDNHNQSDELQLWDVRFEQTHLSNGFLGLECFNDHRNPNQSPPEVLPGPDQWIFHRSVHRELNLITDMINHDQDHHDLKQDQTVPHRHQTRPRLQVCKVMTDWKVRYGTFLLLVKHISQGHPIQLQCLVVNAQDLSTIKINRLPLLEDCEIRRITLSYHGVLCCTVDDRGQVKASPLITPEESNTVVALIMSAIHNRESVDDISRLLSSTTDGYSKNEKGISSASMINHNRTFNHSFIFQQLSSFLAHYTISPRNLDLDPFISTAWSLGFDLWSATPGYQGAAELALIGRRLYAALAVGISVKAEQYSRSIWQMIGISKWYTRLCQRIISSIDPDSNSSHLCLLPVTSCTFYYLFRMAMVINAFSQWLSIMKSNGTMNGNQLNSNTTTNHQRMNSSQSNSSMASQISSHPGQDQSNRSPIISLHQEIEIAKVVFGEIWDYQNLIHMESWGKLLQDIGRNLITKPTSTTDHSKSSIRQIEYFSAPLAATDPSQVQEAVQTFKEFVEHHPQLIKAIPSKISKRSSTPLMEESTKSMTLKYINQTVKPDEDRIKYDVLTGAKLQVGSTVNGDLEPSKRIKLNHPSTLTPKPTLGGNLKDRKLVDDDNQDSIYGSMKECVKCRSRSMREVWSYNQMMMKRMKLAGEDVEVDEDDLMLRGENKKSLEGGAGLGITTERLMGTNDGDDELVVPLINLPKSHSSTSTSNSHQAFFKNSKLLKPNNQKNFGTSSSGSMMMMGPFDFSIKEFNRRCICSGLWVSPSPSTSSASCSS